VRPARETCKFKIVIPGNQQNVFLKNRREIGLIAFPIGGISC